MVIRIRLGVGPKLQRKQRKNQHIALGLAALITPAAVMALVLAAWRLAADLKITREFPIADGIYSHWQIWLALGVAMQFISSALNRYGKSNQSIPKSVETPERTLAESRS